MPGSAGSVDIPPVIISRMATAPSVAAHAAILSATEGSVGSTGLTKPIRLIHVKAHFRWTAHEERLHLPPVYS
jgi:hypothetical protein